MNPLQGQSSPESQQAEVEYLGGAPGPDLSADSLRTLQSRVDELLAEQGIVPERRRYNEVTVPDTEVTLSEVDPGQLEFAGGLLEQLEDMMAGRTTETMVCLTGETDGERAIVTGFYKPQILSEEGGRVDHFPCDEAAPDHVGDLHNHPLHKLDDDVLSRALEQVRGKGVESAVDLCYLSPGDQASTLFDYGIRREDKDTFKVVMVGDRVRCWWTWDQIDARDLEAVISHLEGQVVEAREERLAQRVGR